MKKSLIAFALLSAFASVAFAHEVTGSVTGTNSVTSSSGTSAYVNGTGSSFSQANNTQSALTSATTGGSVTGFTERGCGSTTDVRAGNISIGGTVVTSGSSNVSNVSTGSGQGSAEALGSSVANVSGSGQFHTTSTGPKGDVSGSAGAVTESHLFTGTNGSASTSGFLAAGFGASSSASLVTYTGHSTQTDVKNASTDSNSFAVGNVTGNAVGNAVIIANHNEGGAGSTANASSDGKVSVKVTGHN